MAREFMLPRRERLTLASAAILQPLKQGSCDALCGLYAILNALRLAAVSSRRLTAGHVQTLFAAGIEHIDRAGLLAAATCDGVPVPAWHTLADELTRIANTLAATSLILERQHVELTDVGDAFEQIELWLRVGKPVLVSLEGKLSHYSVISGYSRTSLRLFDSAGLKRLRRDACTVDRTSSTNRYFLDTEATIAIGPAD